MAVRPVRISVFLLPRAPSLAGCEAYWRLCTALVTSGVAAAAILPDLSRAFLSCGLSVEGGSEHSAECSASKGAVEGGSVQEGAVEEEEGDAEEDSPKSP